MNTRYTKHELHALLYDILLQLMQGTQNTNSKLWVTTSFLSEYNYTKYELQALVYDILPQ